MSDKELGKVAEAHDVFVQIESATKARLTTALRNNGHTVGF